MVVEHVASWWAEREVLLLSIYSVLDPYLPVQRLAGSSLRWVARPSREPHEVALVQLAPVSTGVCNLLDGEIDPLSGEMTFRLSIGEGYGDTSIDASRDFGRLERDPGYSLIQSQDSSVFMGNNKYLQSYVDTYLHVVSSPQWATPLISPPHPPQSCSDWPSLPPSEMQSAVQN